MYQHHCEKPEGVIGRLFDLVKLKSVKTAFSRNPFPAPVIGRLIGELWRAVTDLFLKIF
jgi:hypothetical protein